MDTIHAATIYTSDTLEIITDGLQTCRVCDEALNTARELAGERGELVLLEDADGLWLVPRAGKCMEVKWEGDEIRPV